jgi:BirA family biotin operon repressor/biotin-[acetyl-CoA-carboxylase] ligase
MADAFLDADPIRAATFVRHVEIHDTLGSTNDRAAELARQTDIDLPALVVARHQTAGKGRGRNKWWSADGALTFSVLLDPTELGISPSSWPRVSLAAAVAICDALLHEAPQAACAIKWPNDVLIDGGKVCGILIESPSGPAHTKNRLILGIGINVNNSRQRASQDVPAVAASLCDITGRQHDLQAVLAGVLNTVATRFAQLAANDPKLVDVWQQLNLLDGKYVVVADAARQIEGQCVEIAGDGALALLTPFGVERIYSGSIQAVE